MRPSTCCCPGVGDLVGGGRAAASAVPRPGRVELAERDRYRSCRGIQATFRIAPKVPQDPWPTSAGSRTLSPTAAERPARSERPIFGAAPKLD